MYLLNRQDPACVVMSTEPWTFTNLAYNQKPARLKPDTVPLVPFRYGFSHLFISKADSSVYSHLKNILFTWEAGEAEERTFLAGFDHIALQPYMFGCSAG